LRRPCEGAFFVAEELTFEQFPWYRGTIHWHEAPCVRKTTSVEGPRYELF
jgi:hypothetical protein